MDDEGLEILGEGCIGTSNSCVVTFSHLKESALPTGMGMGVHCDSPPDPGRLVSQFLIIYHWAFNVWKIDESHSRSF
ncbi:hypothetical protein AMTR_s00060p00189400 [Amborella trichopoda]|uniref:Uncharacterized protein n=1 Tax=Amborella trichopoda TaxID=13333 RepID=W1NKD2_AMBTC|nr:hypothetical protein AMTR_s00060p00189400 [Amborella trichopoda]